MISPDPDDGGFTLIEMMVVIAIIGIVASSTAIRMDAFGTDTTSELDRVLTFVRTHHALSLRTSRVVLIHYDNSSQTLSARNKAGKTIRSMTLSRWSIETNSDPLLRLTPWTVRGTRIKLETEGQEASFVPDKSLALVRES
ncbi:MAG: prepilin-type N-terminal cleavage/methylation domain-containing protein [bacterium]